MNSNNKYIPENSNIKDIKHPLGLSIRLTLLLLIFPIISGAIISIVELNEIQGRIVQTFAFVFASIIGLVVAKNKVGSLASIGFRKVQVSNLRDYIWFIPIIIIEILPFFFGLKEELNIQFILTLVLFTIAVGFTEELYFRGIIANILRKKSLVYAILVSSALFGMGHIFNLLSGANIGYTILQIVFAFIFGIVAVEISFLTRSLFIPIIWHIFHNFISLITVSNEGTLAITIGVLQGFILLLYGIFLWKRTINFETNL